MNVPLGAAASFALQNGVEAPVDKGSPKFRWTIRHERWSGDANTEYDSILQSLKKDVGQNERRLRFR